MSGGGPQEAGWRAAEQIASIEDLALALRHLRRREARRRGDAALTYRQLAAKTGWSHAVIGQYFTGKVLPPTDRFDILIGLLGAGPAEQGALATARDRVEESGRPRPAADARAAHARADRPAQAAHARADRPAPTPRQLPCDVPGFSGRGRALAELTGLLREGRRTSAIVITALSGTAGIGKTALAVHWAHRVAPEFADGQLYLNLRGFDPGGSVMSPDEALRGLLEALDVPPDAVPAGRAAQVNLYRSLLAGRRMLVLLDNARDADQVRPLLPGTPGCLAVVTSRNRLTSLVAIEGARPLTVDLFDPAEARELLAGRLGPARIAAEPDAAEEIAVLCAGLPLALAIAAAQVAVRPGFPLAVLAGRLRDARGALDALHGGDLLTDLRAVFSWSYDTLSPPAARLFRLLGLHPGPGFGVAAAASLAGVPAAGAARLLAELTEASLLSEPTPGRYTLHDLLRAHAAELASGTGDRDERHAAIGRLLDHYLLTGDAATRLLDPYEDVPLLEPAAPEVTAAEVTSHDTALAWFTEEHASLLGAVEAAGRYGFDAQAWRLASTVKVFLERRGHWRDLVTVQRAAVAAADRLADRPARARTRGNLARACAYLGYLAEAGEHLRVALDIFAGLGDPVGQAGACLRLGGLLAQQGRYADALGYARQALDLFGGAGHRSGYAKALNNIGWYHAQLGDHRESLAWCRRALAEHRELGDRRGQADTLDSLGYAHRCLDDHRRAADCYLRAVELYRDLGDRYSEACGLDQLGDVRLAAQDAGGAVDAWREALEILTGLGHADAANVRFKLRRPAAPGPAGMPGPA